MNFPNMLIIKDTAQDTFFGVIAIISVIVLIYALGFAEIARKRSEKLRKAKKLAVEGLNMRKLNEAEDDHEE